MTTLIYARYIAAEEAVLQYPRLYWACSRTMVQVFEVKDSVDPGWIALESGQMGRNNITLTRFALKMP